MNLFLSIESYVIISYKETINDLVSIELDKKDVTMMTPLQLPFAYGILYPYLTEGGLVTHICVSILTIIGSDIGLSPERRQAIIWTNAGILLIGTLGTNFS